jgi:hypothetical protein
MNANRVIQKNCPSFDFDIGGITVDVKYSSRHNTGVYLFQTGRKVFKPDFYAVFCALSESKDLKDGYRLFLIPAEFVKGTQAQFTPGKENPQWLQFEVKPEELAGHFDAMVSGEFKAVLQEQAQPRVKPDPEPVPEPEHKLRPEPKHKREPKAKRESKPKPEPKPKREPKPRAKPEPEPVAKPKPRVSLPEVDDFWDDDDDFEMPTATGMKRVKRMPNGATITQHLRH